MANHDNAHDKLFKSTLADPKDAAKELRAVLPPALASRIDFASIAPLPGTFVDEVLRDAHADLLFTVRYAEQEALLYVLLEHKSEVDRWTLLQLLRYMLRIWEKYLAEKPAKQSLLPIIPIIIHHSETGWTAPTHFHGLFAPEVLLDPELRRLTPEFDALLDDISFRDDADLRSRAMGPEATLGLFFLRDGRREGRVLAQLANWADLFRTLMASPNGRRALLQLFSYLSKVAPQLGLKELSERVHQAIPETETLVMTLAEQLFEQGEKAGREQGEKVGREQGEKAGREQGEKAGREKTLRKTVRRLLELKFGALNSDVYARVDAATEADLERYTERVLTATSVGEVLGD